MAKRPTRAEKWLRIVHLYLACTWGGGAASLFVIHCLFRPGPGPELYGRNLALLYVDTYILMPSAVGCLLTGLLYCHLTRWGYFKCYWVVVKLAVNLLFLLFGFFWFIPLIQRLVNSSLNMNWYMGLDPGYTMQIHMVMVAAQALLVLVLVIISVLKPWGKTHLHVSE